ncbi:MAG: acyl carrier protein [Deltaproteobacteria bacterium]|nr:acyl carrier protein [Deltaproteobacteria bacterium]
MDVDTRSQVRHYITQRLALKGHGAPIADDQPLFSSGMLDSLDAVELVVYVEDEFGINFSEINFDLTLLDSIAAVCVLVDRHHKQSHAT